MYSMYEHIFMCESVVCSVSNACACGTCCSSAPVNEHNSHSPDSLSTEVFQQVAATLEKDSRLKKLVYRVEGLDCADCAAKVEKALSRQKGISSVRLDFASETLAVAMNPELTNAGSISKLVRNLGYSLKERSLTKSVAGQQVNPNEKTPPLRFPWFRNLRLLLTTISGAFWALGFIFQFTGLEAIAMASFFVSVGSGGFYTACSGYYSLKSFTFDMNFLMTVAVIGAMAIGEWAEGATVVFLFAAGNALQTFTLEKTRNSIRSLMSLTPPTAVVRRGEGECALPVEEISINDLMIIQPGERIPLDGEVVTGNSSVNQAPITGESIPMEKTIGSTVYAGTINGNGFLEVRVTRLVADTTIAKIIRLVEEAQSKKAPSQLFVDKFARYYTPVVIAVAAGVAVIPPLFGQPFAPWFYRALELLVVSCPCALVISTPISIVAAIGNAAKNGVLIKGGQHLEQAGKIQVLAFDKTGTLTEGKPKVTDFENLSSLDESRILGWVGAIESKSKHPLAQAILDFLRSKQVTPVSGSNFEAMPGFGVAGTVEGQQMVVASPKWFSHFDLTKSLRATIDQLQSQGKTVMLLGSEQEIYALFAVADTLRQESQPLVSQLKSLGLERAVLLTGDNKQTAQAIGSRVQVDEVYGELLPEEKVNVVREYVERGKIVGMVGDGINDAPALATAHVGIAMGGIGADAAMETADIVLMEDNLSNLPFTIRLSRQTLNIIKQNIWFSLIIKGVALALILPNWLTLWLAVLSDTGAAFLVTLNSMRLLRTMPKNTGPLSPGKPF